MKSGKAMESDEKNVGSSMDEAAEAAAKSFRKLEDAGANKAGVEALRGWWRAHFATAGHKRLAKILLATSAGAPKEPKETDEW